jgi:hypothetical protein
LAWRTVVWAIEQGGRKVYDAVRTAFDQTLAPSLMDGACSDQGEAADALASHGSPSRATQRAVQNMVAKGIVLPIAASLATLLDNDRVPTVITPLIDAVPVG